MSKSKATDEDARVDWLGARFGASKPGMTGAFRVTRRGRPDQVVRIDVPPISITNLAEACGLGASGIEEQVHLAERVLEGWGRREIGQALRAGSVLPTDLTLETSAVTAQTPGLTLGLRPRVV